MNYDYEKQQSDDEQQYIEAIMNHTYEPQPIGGLADLIDNTEEE